jgi:hypothetical protein
MTIPVYNYLIDIIEKFTTGENESDEEESSSDIISTINNRAENTLTENIISAANNARTKLLKYYSSSDGLVYIIAISMY